uniref:CDP-diacylglycerol--glycerol-3-phosphate 3-phosphatidyltransferase, mitochondrial isoform X1 n=1 Tax=Myxine glutinosa TaxID=7769 RepID=UPI0035900387
MQLKFEISGIIGDRERSSTAPLNDELATALRAMAPMGASVASQRVPVSCPVPCVSTRRPYARRRPDSGGDLTESGCGDPCTGSKTLESPLTQFSWLGRMGPSFSVPARNVRVLSEPWEFYRTLKENIEKAKSRVVLASLYLGTGEMEHGLVVAMEQAVRNGASVHVLLDCVRASRGEKNSRTMLLPLLQTRGCDAEDRTSCPNVRISLFLTPDLRGAARLVRGRLRETVSLQHMKVYVTDDEVLISGANLSESYFVDRQDRYLLLSHNRLADFICEMLQALGGACLQLHPDGSLGPPPLTSHPLQGSKRSYCAAAQQLVESVLSKHKDHAASDISDTVVYPLVQMPMFGIRYDEEATSQLLSRADHRARVSMATGYFNPPEAYAKHLMRSASSGRRDILVPSPPANGFWGAGGLASGVAGAYTYITAEFARRLHKRYGAARTTRTTRLWEYSHKGWSFHGKGLWYYPPKEITPSLTFIGSPNFGLRSVHRDLEMQMALITSNPGLRERLRQEERRLYKFATEVTLDSVLHRTWRVPLWVRLVTPLIRSFL